MQIDGATAVAIFALIVTIAVAIISSLSGYATKTRDTEINRRLFECERELRGTKDAIHKDEVETVRLQGEVALVKQAHDGFERDVAEIKNNMVTKGELKSSIEGLSRRLDDLVTAIRSGSSVGRYSSSSSQQSVPSAPLARK